MDNKFRIMTLQKIAANAGILSTFEMKRAAANVPAARNSTTMVATAPVVKQNDSKIKEARGPGALTEFVKKHLGVLTEIEKSDGKPSDFKSKFLKLKAGPEREKLVYEEILKRKPFAKMVPITIPGPGGTKITYEVMPDYITIDGIRVPMSGQTAQKVADHFGMSLPTSKMSKQIWDAADIKIRPSPLSAGGRIGGKYYSGKEVVQSKISDSDSAVAYSEMIERDIKESGKSGLVAGHMKDIIAPENPNKLGLYGWFGESGDPLEPSITTGHDTSVHTEYGAGVRLVGKITVTTPDGKTITTTMDKLLNSKLYKAVSTTTGAKRYALT